MIVVERVFPNLLICPAAPWIGKLRESPVKRRIRLRGINGDIEGKVWESENLLRTGRLNTLEIVLDDTSVSRRHAEVRSGNQGWRVRDLGSTNGTFLNGTRLGPGEWPVRVHDIIRCGNVTLVVDMLREGKDEDDDNTRPADNLLVEAVASNTWEDALRNLAFDRNRDPRPGEQLLALLRAGHHLVNIEDEDNLLHSILNDAVSTLDAQRGAIVLADAPTGPLRLRALASGHNQIPSRPGFCQNLAQRSFARGESILCCSVDEDPELVGARSIAEGTMASVLCILLRTPRKKLGVLHLDRGPLQKPFTKDDLHLADAMAAHVSAGIECAELLKKKDALFYATITMLSQAVEVRDEYTGNHTERVSQYAYMLGQQLDLPAEELHWIKMGTPLHDIGKIGINDAILRKPGKLTPQEFEIMKTHTTLGAKIIGQVPDLAPVVPIVRSHHERWDGMGYPDGTKGLATPRIARIVAVADAFDAMTSNRPYRDGMNPDSAFAEVERMKGKQFDPEAAEAFLSIRPRILQEMQTDNGRDNGRDNARTPAPHLNGLRLAT
jgi:HD-GYP domain-containing protein (c-di-GMP phosphodiesterase class II)/pSer/pThr/pTyr-binding forkhead associated (FHA) protein